MIDWAKVTTGGVRPFLAPIRRFEGHDVGFAPYSVAARDAPPAVKLSSEFLCDNYPTDDQAIQAAINALPAGGGRVALSEEPFILAAKLLIPNTKPVALVGQGRLITILTLANGVDDHMIDVVSGNGHVFSDFTLDGNKANQGVSRHGFDASSLTNTLFQNVGMRNITGSGIKGAGIADSEVRGCVFNSNNSKAILFDTGSIRCLVIGCRAYDIGDAAYLSDLATEITFLGCLAKDCGAEGFQLSNTWRNVIKGCIATGGTYGIREMTSVQDTNIIEGNILYGNTTNLWRIGLTSIIRNNVGYKNEGAGTGSIANGTTADVIAHGLDYTPVAADIVITLTENPTTSPGAIWVDTIGAANFTVNCENDPGASNLSFSWAVRQVSWL